MYAIVGAHFGLFFMYLVVISLTMTQFFRLLIVLFPDLAAANSFGGFALLFLLLFSGFIVPQSAVPYYWYHRMELCVDGGMHG